MEKIKQYKYYIAFMLIAILAFWQIVFYIHPVKYDLIDYCFPWRFYIGECLQHRRLPFWNPYQSLGYPIHADPSSGAWYPFVWIIGWSFGYNIYTIGLELWLHIFIAAVGFYKLSKTLKLSSHTAFIAAVCYMLCGLFIGNAQHLTFIISACWLPFVLNYYLKMGQEKTFVNSLTAAFFLFLMITGGYPAFTIILIYLLLIFFFYYAFKLFKEDGKKGLLLFTARNALFFITAALLSSGILLSIYEAAPYITGTHGFSLEEGLFGPFSPQAAISFLLPFASIKDLDFFSTDISMSNAYFGILMFLFFVMGVFLKKTFQYKILLGFGLFCLAASFGSYLPVREFLFNYVPMMNTFRFPSVFRLFTIIGFLLTGAWWFDNFIQNDFDKNRKKLKTALILLIAILMTALITAGISGHLDLSAFIKNDLFYFSKTSTLSQHIAFQAGIQFFIAGIFLIIVWKVKERKLFLKYSMAVIVFELIFNAQLNEPYTAYYGEFSAKASNNHIRKFPAGFPQLPDIAIADVQLDQLYFGPFWKNVTVFQKQISAEGFNSFAFTGHESLKDEFPQLYKNVLKNKIVFLSDKIYEEGELERFKKDSAFTNKTLFFKKEDFDKLKTMHFESSKTDTAKLISFAPDKFIVKTKTVKPEIITLLQNNYRGWEIFINQQQTAVYTSDKTFISAALPAGEHIVTFVYRNSGIKAAMWVCLFTLFLTVSIIVGSRKSTSDFIYWMFH